MNNKDVRKKGFTLIELLVIIAIILVLASILFPVFGRARESARRSSCQSNLKQIGLAMLQYTQDYDERFPMDYWHKGSSSYEGILCPSEMQNGPCGKFKVNRLIGASPIDHYVTWMDAVSPYIKSTQIFDCISADRGDNEDVPSYGYSSGFFNPSNYAYDKYAGQPSGGISAASIERPSRVFMVVDNATYDTLFINPPLIRQYIHAPASDPHHGLQSLHLDGMNAVYADGHVKWQSQARIDAGIVSTVLLCDTNQYANDPDYNSAYCSSDWNPFITQDK